MGDVRMPISTVAFLRSTCKAVKQTIWRVTREEAFRPLPNQGTCLKSRLWKY